ncbi:NAD-dependent epimerase/dehydratase family protein [Microvirga massiliensis]|uniref:NAD-dependent epimerase/dehydratase family protein n=1 Tax=Microvirga massiliensis TaxID=1033741 RepID=UPI00062B3639|nr:NAD-dependent epimerase/dehydratase family protein [Microvirga massiliensis]
MIGIYGANGFIGRHLIARLVSRKLPVRAVSRHIGTDLIDRFPKGVDFLEGDIQDSFTMASSLQGVQTIVQLISTSSPGLQNRYNVLDIRDNVIPHVEFLQSAILAGVKKYIFISSGGTVYGPGAKTPIREDAPTNPISSHGLTKLAIEKYLQMHGYVDDLNYVILRVANPFGPGQAFRKGQGLIPAVLSRYSLGQPVQIIGDGRAQRDYIFIDDVIDAIEASIARETAHKVIINVGSGRARSILEVVDAMESVLGFRFEREFVLSRKTDVDVNVLDIRRARQLLDWAPKTDFRQGLAETLLDAVKMS